MLKHLFNKKKKQLLQAPIVSKRAKTTTIKAIKFFNGEVPATDLIEIEKKRKFKHSGYSWTRVDDFYEEISSSDFWGTVMLIATTTLIVCIAYWGFMQ